ncbi:MAG: CYTH domain-containing protein [Gammaproteobacteria bacterium]
MPTEIERKFLIRSDGWRSAAYRSERMRQGYIANGQKASVRVRVAGARAVLNIKAAAAGARRAEYEYVLSVADAEEMLATLCPQLIEKTRYWAQYAGHVWEVDVFEGLNTGLIVAEIELAHVNEVFALPPWIGKEVTGERRYYNAALAERPFTRW